MHLIYLDEPGNSGSNLSDAAQPVFVLCAMIVAEQAWQSLESDLERQVALLWPNPRPDNFEIHAAELANPKTAAFRSKTPSERLAFVKSWLSSAAQHGVRIVYRAIVKQKYSRWLQQSFGAGVVINPHIAAFSLIAQVVNSHLAVLPGKPLGIFISDENHQVARDVDKSIKLLRGESGALRLTQIVEKGFFVESHRSLVLQLCDLCAFTIRRREEAKIGGKSKPVYDELWKSVEPIVTVGDEKFRDTIGWLELQQKKERPGA